MRKLIRPAALLAVFLVIVFGFSYLVDPANVFYSRYDKTVAEILLSGKNAEGVENMDDRRFLECYAAERTQPIGTLVLGSSRAMQVTQNVTGDPDTFIAAVTGSDLRDCISAYFLFADKGLVPENVVLSLDFWYLSRGNMDTRALTAGYEKFCDAIGSAPVKSASSKMTRISDFFSFSYFQSSVSYLLSGKQKTLPVATDAYEAQTAIRRADGSYSYEESLRQSSQETIDRSAEDKKLVDNFAVNFSGIDQDLCDQLRSFLSYLQSEGISVRLLLSPVHPIYYDYMKDRPEVYDIVFQTEDFYRSLGEELDIPVCGSYDPDAIGITNSDFYDAVHPRESAVMRYYDLQIEK